MSKLKVGAVILIISLTIFGFFQLMEGVTRIKSTGVAMGVVTPDGSVYYKCDESNSNSCTIQIKPPVQ